MKRLPLPETDCWANFGVQSLAFFDRLKISRFAIPQFSWGEGGPDSHVVMPRTHAVRFMVIAHGPEAECGREVRAGRGQRVPQRGVRPGDGANPLRRLRRPARRPVTPPPSLPTRPPPVTDHLRHRKSFRLATIPPCHHVVLCSFPFSQYRCLSFVAVCSSALASV